MGLTIKNEQKPRELAPEGTHTAICVRVLDLGTQHSEKWGDKHKINLAFELLDEQTDEGEPFVVYKQYTASLSNRSTLAGDLKSWLNQKFEKDDEFDLEDLLGKAGLVTIVHTDGDDDKVYANIDTITGLPKNTKVRKASEKLVSLFLNDDFDQEVFSELPEFLQERIASSPEYKQLVSDRKPAKQAKSAKPTKSEPTKKTKTGKR
jgi:hypothetical protein